MGKLVVTEFTTLDGVVEDPGGAEGGPNSGWSMGFPTDEGMQFKFEELQAADVQLLGRITYQGFAKAWPAMEEETGDFGKKMVYPIVLGQGKRLFTDPSIVTRLHLVESRTAGPDVSLHIYQPAR